MLYAFYYSARVTQQYIVTAANPAVSHLQGCSGEQQAVLHVEAAHSLAEHGRLVLQPGGRKQTRKNTTRSGDRKA